MSDIKKVIGVFTTKGGTGKTTLAVNLAYALGKTLLVEMDRNFTLMAMLKTEATGMGVFIKQGEVLAEVKGIGLVSVESKVAPATWVKFFEIVKGYDYVIFDFHNAITQDILPPLQKTDIVIIPSIPTMEGFGAYLHTKKNLESMGIKHLGVANMVHKSLLGVMREEREIIKKMKNKGDFWEQFIPYDKNVVKASFTHRIAVEEYPKSPFAKAVINLKEVIR